MFVRFVSSDGACPVVGLLALPSIFIANQKWSADASIVESDTPFESLTTQRKPLACAHFTGEQLPSRARPQVFPSVSSVPPPLLLRSLLSAPGPLPDVPQLCVLAVRVWGPVVDAASTVAPPVAVRVTVATESGKKVEVCTHVFERLISSVMLFAVGIFQYFLRESCVCWGHILRFPLRFLFPFECEEEQRDS